MDETLGIVGGGRMGEALLAGLLDAGVCRGEQVTVVDVDGARVEELVDRHGVAGSTDNEAALAADVVLLAIKPQVLPDVLGGDGGAVRDEALVVSIAAGVSTARLDELLPGTPAIVRVMPNTPALVRQAASVVAAGPRATPDHLRLVHDLFAPLGTVRSLPESSIDAVTALSGSGPAYVFLLAEALIDAGVLLGLPRELATELSVQTLMGSARMLRDSGRHPVELREMVSSPGGTTVAAVRELERAGLRTALFEAVEAARRRAGELATGG